MTRCPACGSPDPRKYPRLADFAVMPCPNPFHAPKKAKKEKA